MCVVSTPCKRPDYIHCSTPGGATNWLSSYNCHLVSTGEPSHCRFIPVKLVETSSYFILGTSTERNFFLWVILPNITPTSVPTLFIRHTCRQTILREKNFIHLLDA